MEAAARVLERLARIDELRDTGAPAGVLLEEVRALLAEGEEWVRAEGEGTDEAAAALARSREALARAPSPVPI